MKSFFFKAYNTKREEERQKGREGERDGGKEGLRSPPPVHGCMLNCCLTLQDPVDCGPPGSSVYGIFQARILEWIAIPFSSGSSGPGMEPGSPILQVDSLPSEPPGKPKKLHK